MAADPSAVGSPRWAAVLGQPIGHSLSPALHRAAYAALGLAWSYDARDVGVASLPSALAEARSSDLFGGYSLTMPLKAAAVPLLDHVVGSLPVVNTVVPGHDGALVGHNTDVDGIASALALLPITPGPALVLGAGGTAAAAVAALLAAGFPVTVASRREPLDGATPWVPFRSARVADYAVVVATTPAGATDALAASGWARDVGLVDVVYAPWPTRLAAAARTAGAPVVGGLEVLLGQAVEQVRLMTGCSPPVAAMRAALVSATASSATGT